MGVSAIAAAVLLVIAFVTDVRSALIPNRLTFTACICGWIYHVAIGGVDGFLYTLGGTAAGFAMLLVLYLLKGVGAGDVKLFAALGSLVGAAAVGNVFIYSILFAGAIGAIVLVCNRSFMRSFATRLMSLLIPAAMSRLRSANSVKPLIKFPFMLAVAPGAAAAWFFEFQINL
ncbi:prepilin peptidase [Paenibacillaceae bacterium]|nr:prepilin peptidase [Paenibacillaceae bacterium]